MEPGSTIRVWVPGCATGEEAYSIAMQLVESMDRHKNHFDIQIFATDIDENAIEYARVGAYPDSIAADVTKQRLNRFFTKEDNLYKIKKQIREMVVFAVQNLIKDPPFSKLNMVSCRNLLIYMAQVLQKKIIPLFHYTLLSDGILVLGSSESIGEFTDHFIPVDSKWKMFKRKGLIMGEEIPHLKMSFHDTTNEYLRGDKNKSGRETDISELAKKLILENYSPPCVLLNNKFEILYISGNTNKFLGLRDGEPSFNILKLVNKELLFKLSAALQKASQQHMEVIISNLKIKYGAGTLTTDLIVKPVIKSSGTEGMLLVVFKDKSHAEVAVKKKKAVKVIEDEKRVTILEQELQSTKEYLQSTIEELETSNEELKSANEELQSTNEELQSTNEELETSKEEMQSTNEELITVNSELQNKVEELSQANNDINNLLASTKIGTIFLDNQLLIKRFTPAMTKIFNLIQSDIGRPISHITGNIRYSNMETDSKEVLATLASKAVEIQSKNENWYSMRISPYRTTENVIDGVVITFVDINKIKHAEMTLESEKKYRALFETMKLGVIFQSHTGKITSANQEAEKILGKKQLGGPDFIDSGWHTIHEDGTQFLKKKHPAELALKTGKEVQNVIMGILNPDTDTYKWIKINSIPMFRDKEKKPYQIYTTLEKITDPTLVNKYNYSSGILQNKESKQKKE